MKSAVLAMLFLFASPDGWSSPEASVALAMYEGEWGFVSLEPEDSWYGQGMLDGAAACGADKALKLDIREETLSDGTRLLVLRKHPEAEWGAAVTMLDVTDDDRARLTATLLDEEEVYERNGDALAIVYRDTRMNYERCD